MIVCSFWFLKGVLSEEYCIITNGGWIFFSRNFTKSSLQSINRQILSTVLSQEAATKTQIAKYYYHYISISSFHSLNLSCTCIVLYICISMGYINCIERVYKTSVSDFKMKERNKIWSGTVRIKLFTFYRHTVHYLTPSLRFVVLIDLNWFHIVKRGLNFFIGSIFN